MNSLIKGITYLLMSQVFLVTMDAIAKYLTTFLPIIFLVWVRYAVLCILILLFIYPAARGRLFSTRHIFRHLLRSVFLVVTSILGMYGLHELPLAETAGLAFVCPLVTILLAKIFLREQVGLLRWCCMGMGVIGALIIVHPGGSISLVGASCVLLAAIAFSFYQIMTRQMAVTELSITLLAYPSAVSAFILSIVVPLWFPEVFRGIGFNMTDLVFVAFLGILGGIGHYFISRAFFYASVSSLAPFMYCQLLWAITIGWYFFGQLPDSTSFLGMAVIIFAGLMALIHSESGSR